MITGTPYATSNQPAVTDLLILDDLKSLTDDWLMSGIIHNSDIAGIGGPDGYVNMIDMVCLSNNWGIAENKIKYDEDFETGDFSKLPGFTAATAHGQLFLRINSREPTAPNPQTFLV